MRENLKRKYLVQFEELIKEGSAILMTVKMSPSWPDLALNDECSYIPCEHFQPWRIQCVNLLMMVVSPQMGSYEQVKIFCTCSNFWRNAEELLATLKGVYNDFKFGLLDDLSLQIEGNIAVDYLKQANDLLVDKDNIDNSYIPAAVLAGVVLEKSIRTLCERQTPSLVVVKENGDFKKVMPLVDELIKSGVFTQPMARKIQFWLDIRNSAAHGRTTDFKPDDVKEMLRGVNNFMADYLS